MRCTRRGDRRALTWEEVKTSAQKGYVDVSIHIEPDYEKYSTEELLETLKKHGAKIYG